MKVWTLAFYSDMQDDSYVIGVYSSREIAIKAMNQYNKNIGNLTLEEKDSGLYGVSYSCGNDRYEILYHVVNNMPEEW